MRKLIQELHRRSLWQVLGIYLGGAWIAHEVVKSLTESLGLPAWFPAFALVLLIIGLPVVIATAFVQEGLPSGSDGQVEGPRAPVAGPTAPHRLFTWRNAVLGGVAAFALWGVVAAAWLLLGSPRGMPDRTADPEVGPSIAVLPFVTRSVEEADAFFAQGVHDDILTQLSRIDALKVISRTSVMQYADTDEPIGVIAQELGVSSVLEGGVQRSGSRVRVTAQLIDAATDAHLWAESYDETLTTDNLFSIQADIARSIARALEAELTEADSTRLNQPATRSLVAWEEYSRGRHQLALSEVNGFQQAVDRFSRAIEADPEFAAAHAGLAASYILLSSRFAMPMSEAVALARPAAERALELDPELAEGYTARGFLLEREGDRAGAERDYLRALELDPNSDLALGRLAGLEAYDGRFESARGHLQRAVELNPLDLASRANLAYVELVNRDYVGGATAARRLIELDPEASGGFYMLAFALAQLGDYDEAITAAQRAVELDPDDLNNVANVAYVHAKAGDRETAVRIAEEVEGRGGSLKEIALVYAALGDIERAFEYLERTLDGDPMDLQSLNVDPSADPLRDDPRFDALLREAGLR